MVYGKEGQFDAERLIDLLEALEKFKAVRDDGDGSAYKVDGVRGRRDVGSAGDFTGSQVVDTSDRDTDIDGGRFRVSNIGGSDPGPQTQEDKDTAREALRFFFSPEGSPFRDFLLEEIVTVVDASSREATQELARRLGLGNLPVPSFVRAMSPALSDNDRRMVSQIGTLVQFLLGDFEGILGGGTGGSGGVLSAQNRLRALIPVVREYGPQLRDFGGLLVARLTEKALSRSLNWATQQLTPTRLVPTN
jgi:aarF domain-containing kinase